MKYYDQSLKNDKSRHLVGSSVKRGNVRCRVMKKYITANPPLNPYTDDCTDE